MATYPEQSLAKLKEFEGCVPWMYRDTVGKVTVGVGLMLPSADAATVLPFTCAGRAATAAEIAADFARDTTMAEGKPQSSTATHIAGVSSAHHRCKAPGSSGGIRGQAACRDDRHDAFPDPVKLALLDMAYNLGPAGRVTGYPRLLAAIEQRHCALAATEYMSVTAPTQPATPGPKRQFLTAVVSTIKAETERWLNRLWRRVRAPVAMRSVYTYGLLRIISGEVWKSECGEAGNPLQRQILYC